MGLLSRIALLALPLAARVAGSDGPSQTKDAKPIYVNAQEAFRDLLNALPEESLHVALNSLKGFRDGIFESDRHGVEQVHQENPPLATKLIVAAVQDLKNKRQAPPPSNGTATTSNPEPSQSDPSPPPSPPPSSSRAPVVSVPVSVTTTNDQGQETVVSSDILSEPTASAVVTSTRTNDRGEEEVITETKPAIVVETTDAEGRVSQITSAVDFAPTPGQQLTKTDGGKTFVTTYTPPPGRVNSVKLITTTGPDGSQSIVTMYTYVDPAAPAPTDGGSQPAGDKPGLQDAAPQVRATGAAVAACVVAGFFLFWI